MMLTPCNQGPSSEGPPILTHAVAGGGGGVPFLFLRAPALLSNCLVVDPLRSASASHMCFFGKAQCW